MSTKRKIAVSNNAWILVEGKLADEDGKPVPFKFSLQCKRLDAETLKNEFADTEETAGDLIKKITFGWKDQRLVLEEDDTPSEFSDDAMKDLMNIAGMGLLCLGAYVKQTSVKAKN